MSDKKIKGIRCPRCNCGHLPVYGTVQKHNKIIRYRRCRHCRHPLKTIEKIPN